MKRKQLESFLYSVVGVVAMFFVLVGFNAITSQVNRRADLTEGKIYTLSAGTRAILEKLDTPVTARLYVTQAEDSTPEVIYLMNYADQVENTLDELRRASGGMLKVEKYNPEPDSDAEDSARLNGIEGQPIGAYGERFYLGVAFSVVDETVALPFLSPSRERLLEYDLVRAISRVEQPERPVLGIMSALPVQGQAPNPMMMQMGQQPQGQDPWVIVSELTKDFTIEEVPITAEEIDPAITVLLVIYPRGISEATEYAIDQFVLRGGKLIAFLDPLSIADNQNPQMNALQRASSSGASLDRLLKAWQVDFDISKVVADPTFKTMVGGRGAQPQENMAVLTLTGEAFNSDDVLTSQVDNLLMPFAGAFGAERPAEGLERTVLIKSTPNAGLMEKMMAQFGGADRDFKAADKEFILAEALTGKFKTAFPEGKPGAAADGEGETEAQTAATESLKESTEANTVILIADSDLLFDPVVARVGNLMGMRFIEPLNGNLGFGQSLVELMAGDTDLIEVRSRATLNRPFTVVKEMEQQAQDAYRDKIRQLEDGLQETQQRLNQLQSAKDTDQRFVLSPEQQAELVKFREQEADVKKQLKEVRKNLRKDIDSLENRLKWANIAGVPLLVTLFGIIVALIKRKKTAAK